MVSICAEKSITMRSMPSLRSIPNIAFKTVPMFVWLMMALSRPAKDYHWALPLSVPLSSRLIDCVMPLALRPQVIFQAPQHFRSSKTQTTCDGCFSPSLRLVQGRTSTVFEGKCRWLIYVCHSGLPIPYIYFVVVVVVASSLKVRRWWHVWSDCLFLVTEPSVYTIRSCGLLFSWTKSLISESVFVCWSFSTVPSHVSGRSVSKRRRSVHYLMNQHTSVTYNYIDRRKT